MFSGEEEITKERKFLIRFCLILGLIIGFFIGFFLCFSLWMSSLLMGSCP